MSTAAVDDRKPTADELAGMQWWNSMTGGRARQGARGRRLDIGRHLDAERR
jgi:hypothetical protein